MISRLVLASATAIFLASAAFGQTPSPPPDASPKDDSRMAPNDAGTMSDDPDDDTPVMPGERMAEPKGPRPGSRFPGRRGMMPPPPLNKAAEFRIHNGPFRFEIRCAEDEPMQACADIAMKLLDQAKAPPPPPR